MRQKAPLRLSVIAEDRDVLWAAENMVRGFRQWSLREYRSCRAANPVSSPHPGRNAPGPAADRDPHTGYDVVLVSIGALEPGLVCLRRLKTSVPSLPVLVISAQWDASAFARCGHLGADGYLTKPIGPEELAAAVSEASCGRPFLCRQAQAAALEYLHRLWAMEHFESLSPREREIMSAATAGDPNKALAAHLGISPGTLHKHLDTIYRKLGVHHREQALRKFLG